MPPSPAAAPRAGGAPRGAGEAAAGPWCRSAPSAVGDGRVTGGCGSLSNTLVRKYSVPVRRPLLATLL